MVSNYASMEVASHRSHIAVQECNLWRHTEELTRRYMPACCGYGIAVRTDHHHRSRRDQTIESKTFASPTLNSTEDDHALPAPRLRYSISAERARSLSLRERETGPGAGQTGPRSI
jgi:hypothetical protein